MASVVDMCNSALNLLGASTISALTDDSKNARLCNQRYEPVRNRVFRSHAWNCLHKRVQLAQNSTAPVVEYSYAYALPSDCLRVLSMEEPHFIFKVENVATHGKVLLTDEGTANIMYVARITNTTLFDSMFVDTLTAKLATDLAYPVTNSVQLQTQMQKLYEYKLSEARSVDGQEGFIDDLVSDTFTTFRR